MRQRGRAGIVRDRAGVSVSGAHRARRGCRQSSAAPAGSKAERSVEDPRRSQQTSVRRGYGAVARRPYDRRLRAASRPDLGYRPQRSEEHTSELQSLMRISYAVFCLKKKNKKKRITKTKRHELRSTSTTMN